MKVKLSILDRAAIINTLPQLFSYKDYLIIKSIRERIFFNEKEVSDYKIKVDGDMLYYDKSKKSDIEIELTDESVRFLTDLVKELDQKGQLQEFQIRLFTKFAKPKKQESFL